MLTFECVERDAGESTRVKPLRLRRAGTGRSSRRAQLVSCRLGEIAYFNTGRTGSRGANAPGGRPKPGLARL